MYFPGKKSGSGELLLPSAEKDLPISEEERRGGCSREPKERGCKIREYFITSRANRGGGKIVEYGNYAGGERKKRKGARCLQKNWGPMTADGRVSTEEKKKDG